jgi:hypothetical protein
VDQNIIKKGEETMSQELEPSEALEATGVPEDQSAASDAADVEALHTEVADLRRQVAEHEAEKQASKHTGRRWVVGLLILLGCILLLGGNAAFWVRDVVLDTETWVATVGPLTRNEVVAGTLSSFVVSEVFAAVNVESVVQEALPEEFAVLSGPLVGGLRDLAGDAGTKLIQSDQFNAVWVAANRTAHGLAMMALRTKDGVLMLKDGALILDLSDVYDAIENTLPLQELGLLSGGETPGEFVLFTSEQVRIVQGILDTIDLVGILLPLLALLSFVIAWLVSLWRNDTVKWIGIGVAITAAVGLVLIAIAQPVVLTAIADPLIRALADEIWDVILSGLIWQTVLLGILGLLIALVAWIFGPSERAEGYRTEVGGWFGRTEA